MYDLPSEEIGDICYERHRAEQAIQYAEQEHQRAERLAETDRLARGTQTPLLVVHDRHDQRVPLGHGLRVHQAWQGSRLLETSHLGHQRILSDGTVIEKVVEFLTEE